MNQPLQDSYTIGGTPVSRAAFYATACDPSRSVVVEACAGAGKTWMLVSRILRALLEGARPQEIVAITFTRKAAGEMRERLTEWLAQFAGCTAEQRVNELILRGMEQRRAVELEPTLAGLHAELLRGGRAVEIRTFHSWFGQLLRAAPLELLKEHGISPELALIEEEADVAREVFQRFFVRVQADPASRAIYQALVQERGRSAVQSWLETAFDKRVEISLAHRNGTLLGSVAGAEAVSPRFAGFEHPLERFEELRERLSAVAAALGASKGAIPQKAGVAIEQALGLAQIEAAFRSAYDALVNKDGAPRSRMGDNAEVPALAEELIDLGRAVDQHLARRLHHNMCHLSLILLDVYEELKRSRGLVDMNDMERGALALLGDPIQAGWIQEKLDSHVRHLLVDEFQDTSPLQWHALHSWLEAYVGAGGGLTAPSVFIVGDPKQSIYRFRRAEPRVFAAAAEFVVQGLGGSVLACDHTRRNAPAVIDIVNQVFNAAYAGFRAHTTEVSQPSAIDGLFLLPEPPTDEAAAGAAADPSTWRPSLTVPRHEVEVHRREAEAQRVAAAIEAMLAQGVAPGEIFVLARKRAALRALSAVLNVRGVGHIAPEDTALKDAPDVRDLIAVLDVIASPTNDLALAHTLRSPLFGATEADLVQLAKACGAVRRLGADETAPQGAAAERPSWWRTLMDLDAAQISPALGRAQRLLASWTERSRDCSAHDLLDAIIQEGGLIARLTAAVPGDTLAVRLHAVQALLCVALELDGGRNGGLYTFVRSLKNRALKLPAPTASDAVQLLTVHGAKGLEAKVVILMDTDGGAARAETSAVAVSWPVSMLHPAAVAFLASEAKAPASLVPLLEEEAEARGREELNGLYVALTRARARIVVSRTAGKQPSKAATWWSQLSPIATELQVANAASGGRQAKGVVRVLAQVPARPAAPGVPGSDPTRDPAIAAVGEALHRVLEWSSGPAGATQPVEALVRSAAQMYGLHGQRADQLAASAQAILASDACRPFFDRSQILWAGNEVPVAQAGEDLRIDRLVCRQEDGQNVWWVLDYKLGANPQTNPDYLRQMGGYVSAVKALQPGEPVRAAFITGRGELFEVNA